MIFISYCGETSEPPASLSAVSANYQDPKSDHGNDSLQPFELRSSKSSAWPVVQFALIQMLLYGECARLQNSHDGGLCIFDAKLRWLKSAVCINAHRSSLLENWPLNNYLPISV
jgi:hypothetical protein